MPRLIKVFAAIPTPSPLLVRPLLLDARQAAHMINARSGCDPESSITEEELISSMSAVICKVCSSPSPSESREASRATSCRANAAKMLIVRDGGYVIGHSHESPNCMPGPLSAPDDDCTARIHRPPSSE